MVTSPETQPAPRVLLKTRGGPIMGMGHVMRSVELVSALQAAGLEVVGFVCNDDAPSREIIASRGHRLWSENDFPAVVLEAQVDVLLLDHPGPLLPLCLEARAVHSGLVVPALDCFEMEPADFDLIINLINHHPTLKVPRSPQVDYHEGPEFAIIRREFAAYRDAKRRPVGESRKVLVTFGGSDPQRHTLRVLEALSGSASKGLQLTVVIGPNFPHRAEAHRLATETGATVYENVSNMAELMLETDLGISGGGTTMLEFASLGVPALIVPQNIPEVRFSDSVAARGAVRTLPMEVTPVDLRRAVLELLDELPELTRLSTVAKETVDGRGQQRIADLILNAISRRQALHA